MLDTNVLLWLLWSDPRLRPEVVAALADPANLLYASVVSVWETAIKVRLGKLNVPPNVIGWMPGQLRESRISLLTITLEHAAGVETLPRHHRDPFDRLLIAQALVESLTLVTSDRRLAAYGVRLLDA